MFRAGWLRWKKYSACSEGVRQVAEQYGNWYRGAEGSDGGPSALQAGDAEEGKGPLPAEGEVGFQTAEGSHWQMRRVPYCVALREPEQQAY